AQHGHLAVAYANKGYLLEKLGNTGEAIDHYRQALQIDPDDAIAGRLLQEAERRRQAAQEKERQDYIDKLVSELLQLQKEGEKAPVQEDTWTSAPLTLWIVDFKLQGIIFSREGEAEVLMLRLTDALENTKRVNVVDRKILEKLLTELKLGATALADPQTALQIGKILAARLISSCSFTRFDSQGQLTMRVIDTETTRIVASIAEIAPKAEDMGRVVDDLVEKLMAKLKIAYPIQGILAKVTDQGVVLNIGRQQGVAPGLTLQVYSNEDPMAQSQNVLEFPSKSAALIEVTDVENALCQAKVIKQMQPLQVGQKAREVSKH
ncbi:MAG: CsgG/HfaB family protein, partial [Desulfobacteraceae bacterium]